jgi:hypothetical protein
METQAIRMQRITERLIAVFFVWLPTYAGRLSAIPVAAASYSAHLLAWPRSTAWSALGMLVAGFITGWLDLGYDYALTESSTWLTLLTCIAVLSPWHAGIFLIALMVGDYTSVRIDLLQQLRHRPFYWSIAALIAPWIYYSLLYLWLVRIPILVMDIGREMGNYLLRLPAWVRYTIPVLFIGLLTLLIYCWGQMTALLIRPLWIWTYRQPTVAAIAPVQSGWWWLVLGGSGGFVLRAVLNTLTSPQTATTVHAARARLMRVMPESTVWTRAPTALRIVGKALLTTLFFSGMFLHTWEAVSTCTVLFLIYALQEGWLIVLPLQWVRWTHRAPEWTRLVLASIVIWHLSTWISKALWDIRIADGTQTFLPVIISVWVSLLIIVLLFPRSPPTAPTSELTAHAKP